MVLLGWEKWRPPVIKPCSKNRVEAGKPVLLSEVWRSSSKRYIYILVGSHIREISRILM